MDPGFRRGDEGRKGLFSSSFRRKPESMPLRSQAALNVVYTKLLSKGFYFESNLVWRRFIAARKYKKNQGFPVFQKLWREHSIPIECNLVLNVKML
jgi:hypothetical protein